MVHTMALLAHSVTVLRLYATLVARCVRPFLHPDGGRTDTYLIEYGGDYFPIKRSTLHTCLDPEQRVQARV